jgi:hypothetical protein
MTPESDDVSLWEQLGIDVDAVVEPLPDDTFARMLEIAVDPATPEADPDLVPGPDAELDVDDLDLDPVDPGVVHGHPAHEPGTQAGDGDHPDLGVAHGHDWPDDTHLGEPSFEHPHDAGPDDTFDAGDHDY